MNQPCPECQRKLRLAECIEGFFLSCEYCLIIGPTGDTEDEAFRQYLIHLAKSEK